MAIIATYCIDITVQREVLAPFNHAEDIQQAEQYSHMERQHQFLAARALLRWLVQRYVNSEQPLQILKHPNGAPYLQLGEQRKNCSISHTDNAVLVGISTGAEVFGLDIECFDQQRWQTSPVIAKYQHGMMREVGQSSLARAQRWNVAEAVVKAEQGKLLEVLQRQPAPLLAQASLGQIGHCCYAIYHPNCPAGAVSVVPVAATGSVDSLT